MLLTPPLGEEQFPVPLPSVPLGGRLTQFLHHWEKFTTDVWVLSVIRGGLDLMFQERPPLSDSPIPMSQTSDKEKIRLLSEEVQSLLLKSVIEEIHPTQSTPGFYSRLFFVPKKTGAGKLCCSRQIGEISWKPKKLGYGNKHPKGPVWWSTYLEEYKL
jgi:hypothetical protein